MTIRTSVSWLFTRAQITAQKPARVLATSSGDSRSPIPTSAPWTTSARPPSCATAIPVDTRVRSDGFSSTIAAARPLRPSSPLRARRAVGRDRRSHRLELLTGQVVDLER